MKIFSFLNEPPVISEFEIKVSIDDSTNDYVLNSESNFPYAIENVFSLEGLPRMIVFSEQPIFENCYLVEGWYEHSRGGGASSRLELIEISTEQGFKSLSCTNINRSLNYSFVFDSRKDRFLFLATGTKKSFSLEGEGGLLTIQSPMIEWYFRNTEREYQGKKWLPELSIPIQSIQGNIDLFLEEVPVSLEWVKDTSEGDQEPRIELRVYSAYSHLISIRTDPIIVKDII